MHKTSLRAAATPGQPANQIGRYFDNSSGCHIIIARPAANPGLWDAYLQGARDGYRKHGVESVLEYDRVRDGRSTALFFVALTGEGRVVGGMRAQGPYQCAAQAHALEEWAGRTGAEQLHHEVVQRIPAGVIEMKTGWVADDVRNRRELSAALARFFVHSLTLLGARYAMATVGAHVVKQWQTTGGVVSTKVTPVAYPDDRYLTKLMWWDSRQYPSLTAAAQLPLLIDEAAQLADQSSAAPQLASFAA